MSAWRTVGASVVRLPTDLARAAGGAPERRVVVRARRRVGGRQELRRARLAADAVPKNTTAARAIGGVDGRGVQSAAAPARACSPTRRWATTTGSSHVAAGDRRR